MRGSINFIQCVIAAIVVGQLVGSASAEEVESPPEIPPVVLSEGHAALCRVKVGDTMPAIEAPQVADPRRRQRLADLYGEAATVVIFWKGDRRMAREQLADVGPDVIEPFAEAGVAVVGIAVDESAASAREVLQQAEADFPNLLDADGQAFAQVGREKLPRTYLLDRRGRILWFDIEYSLATRRELRQALRAVAGPKARPLQRAARTSTASPLPRPGGDGGLPSRR